MSIFIRRAQPADRDTLVDYNRRMAWETEHKELPLEIVTAGVEAVFTDSAKGFYLVAEVGKEIVGQLMITTEWSDWRNGWFWWIQSVYVREDSRRHGIFRTLYQEAERLATAAGDVVGLRLYVERENHIAQRTYARLGMHDAGYGVFEKMVRT